MNIINSIGVFGACGTLVAYISATTTVRREPGNSEEEGDDDGRREGWRTPRRQARDHKPK
jgi:hypothetical protein